MAEKPNLQAVKRRYGIVGRSVSLESALNTALRVAGTDLSVLITGESGTGKEVFSRIIHDNSPRKHEGFIAINCGAIPEGTINSELFGHMKGAFTSAVGDRKGYFETYDGGTIFLDEIGEMPLDTQSYLLRVLESGEYIRVGSSKTQRTDVRVVAATNVDLQERIRKGRFREDLYYRLNTVPIHLPPLRDREGDIYLLFRNFALNFSERQRIEPVKLDNDARRLLERYSWPGNIRELKNAAEQIGILSEKRELTATDLVELLPQLLKRNLPAIRQQDQPGGGNNFQEREILYKVLFDLRQDLGEMKKLVFELIRGNDLHVPDMGKVHNLQLPGAYPAAAAVVERYRPDDDNGAEDSDFSAVYPGATGSSPPPYPPVTDRSFTTEAARPIIVDHKIRDRYAESEVVDENLSLADNERELIRKALRKHNGRRKEAAADLGISERTLYRKIKEYDLTE
ncbi:MAG: sigma-54 dependent transcriptional regulator [Saprospiraceae bacterium]